MPDLFQSAADLVNQYVLPYLSWTLVFPLGTLILVLLFFFYYWHAQAPRRDSLEWIAMRERRPMTFSAKRNPMGKKDALPLLLVTAAYACTAFFQLGSFTNPQSFQSFDETATVEFSLDRTVALTRLGWYTGLGTGDYSLEVSADGQSWTALQVSVDEDNKSAYAWTPVDRNAPAGSVRSIHQKYNTLFKWYFIEPEGGPVQVRYLRLTGFPGKAPLELGELALYDQDGVRAVPDAVVAAQPPQAVPSADLALFDEQDTIPDKSTWYNSSYFDEIYHPRTAYEHIRGIEPYEVSHPPLGKLILSVGIRLFGFTPFGWRFMGTLFGVLMLPILYVFLKNLFGRTAIAFCGTTLFAFDFMHLVQTRIATIDTYGVFFILLAYFFMYRYLTLPAGTSFRGGALPLFLSGLFWGIGAASKWTVIYAGAGLALLYFLGVWFKWRDRPADFPFAPWLVQTLLFSVLCWVVIPVIIYTLSYWPYAAARGNDGGLLDMLGELFSWPFVQLPQVLRGERELILKGSANLVDAMLENQKFMFTYHVGVTEHHPYESRWYQWLVDGRPILYYLDSTSVPGFKAAFACFNNPVVAWTGLLSVVILAVQTVRRRCGKALFLLVGYLSQLLPWFAIGRITFAYHYFPSTLFLVLAISYAMNDMMERKVGRWQWAVYGMTAFSVVLFAAFYPVLIGLMVPSWYPTRFLRWIPGGAWPF